jgi:hypothetical protein
MNRHLQIITLSFMARRFAAKRRKYDKALLARFRMGA